MPKRTVFSDDNENELDVYLNQDQMVYMNIGRADPEDLNGGSIVLDKSDVQSLVEILNELLNKMG